MSDMTCYHPIKAFRSTERNPTTGRYGLTFNATKALNSANPIAVPCGQCIGCRLDKAQAWAARCHHEAQMHEHNCFLTLTYDDQHVPASYSVELREWQLFMKRLRQHFAYTKVRFLACGEYGEKNLRPHYHALIFGIDFHEDRQLLRTRGSQKLRVYTSPDLAKLWPLGSHEIGTVSYKSAGYVARYAMKKVIGDQETKDKHYFRRSPVDGQLYRVAPEFCVMSRRPGIGTSWFETFKSDAFPSDFLIVDGRRIRVPPFYLKKLKDDEAQPIKRARKRAALKHKDNNTKARLAVREEVQSLRAKRLLRELES